MFTDEMIRKYYQVSTSDGLQREVHDRHHCAHSLVFRNVILTNGNIVGLLELISGRRQDAFEVRDSRFDDRLASVRPGAAVQYEAHGDAAYPIPSHVDHGFRGENLSAAPRAFNRALSS